MMDNLIETNTFIKVDASGCQTEGSDVLLMENTLVISIEGELVGSIPYTPQHTEELVVGWLNDEGYISSASEIDSIIISEDNSKALVRMKMCDVQPGCSGSHERILTDGPRCRRCCIRRARIRPSIHSHTS